MESWPVTDCCKDSLCELLKTHDICPLPAYDSHDKLIPPSQYETMLNISKLTLFFSQDSRI